MLFTKLEKPLFLRRAVGFVICASPDIRLGLRVPFSDLGGMDSIMGWPPGGIGRVACCWIVPIFGLVLAWIRGGNSDFEVGAEVGPFVVDCMDERILEASNGAPIRSLGRLSEVGGIRGCSWKALEE